LPQIFRESVVFFLDFKLLENIVAIAEERNISRAAERVFVSQPALSQQLSKLETQLGTPIFFRGKQTLALTQAGEIYVNNAKRILAIQKETYNQIYDIAEQRKGALAIGVSPGRSPMIVSSVYPEFQKQFPGFNIQVFDRYYVEAEEMLTQGKLDLAFALLGDDELAPSYPFSHASLGREDIFLIASRNNPLASRYHQGSDCPVVDLKLFKNAPFALTTKDGKIRRFAEEIFASYGVSPRIRYEVFNIQAITKVVSQSNLCSLIPSGFLPKDDDSLIHFRLKPNRFMEFSICWHPSHSLTTAEQHFIELCQQFHYKNVFT